MGSFRLFRTKIVSNLWQMNWLTGKHPWLEGGAQWEALGAIPENQRSSEEELLPFFVRDLAPTPTDLSHRFHPRPSSLGVIRNLWVVFGLGWTSVMVLLLCIGWLHCMYQHTVKAGCDNVGSLRPF